MGRPLDRANAFYMVRRRVKDAALETPIGRRSFRATGITIYLSNGRILWANSLHRAEAGISRVIASLPEACHMARS